MIVHVCLCVCVFVRVCVGGGVVGTNTHINTQTCKDTRTHILKQIHIHIVHVRFVRIYLQENARWNGAGKKAVSSQKQESKFNVGH